MKKELFILILLFGVEFAGATQQQPDILYYENKKLTLSTGWGHPSPLQTYYLQKNLKYPFAMLHTGNYRGHIATWEISGKKLFLEWIYIEGEEYRPSEYGVKSSNGESSKNKVFADWFSGVIEGEYRDRDESRKSGYSYYFHIKNGRVVYMKSISNKDLESIRYRSDDFAPNGISADISKILTLNENYIAYYFRLSDKEEILYKNREGYLRGERQGSPILMRYSYDHMQWPYNWENFEKNGAPNCRWIVNDGKLYLTEIILHSGLGFYEVDTTKVELSDIFNGAVTDDRVFADWVSGAFLIEYGKEVGDKQLPGYKEFKVSEYVFLRFDKGVIIESYTVPGDFEFNNIPANLDAGLRKIIDDFNK